MNTTPDRWILDASVRRSRNGRVLSGGHPARVMRLGERGSAVLDAALGGRAASGQAEASLLERLCEYGFIHPMPTARDLRAGEVTFVVPARNAAADIGSLVGCLIEVAGVVVVDDASDDPTADVARRAGARVVANTFERGPGGARNSGLAATESELVAFIDSDCVPDAAWVARLVRLFDDRSLALAAPRVRSAPGLGAIERYEERCSPLDLGPRAALVAPGRRLSYVPSAAVLARTEAVRAVDGFDPSLRFGEDVDLVWRLCEAGWTVRYAPSSMVLHRARPSVSGLCRQRFDYGASAVELECRRAGAARPPELRPATLALLAAAMMGPRTMATAWILATAPAGRGILDIELRRHAWLLAIRGQRSAAREIARLMTREWLPATLLAAGSSRRMRRAAIAAAAIDMAAAGLREAPAHKGIRAAGAFPILRVIDHGAYALGCWRRVLARRSPAAVLPRIHLGRYSARPIASRSDGGVGADAVRAPAPTSAG